MTFGDGAGAYLFLFVAGFVATQTWRYLGVFLSRDLSPNSEILLWVRAVSSALIAGLVARMVIFPAGALLQAPLWIRLCAVAAGVIVLLLARRNLAAGIIAGVGVLIIAQFALELW